VGRRLALLITIFGWLAAIGGAQRIIWPQGQRRPIRWSSPNPTSLVVAGILWLVIARCSASTATSANPPPGSNMMTSHDSNIAMPKVTPDRCRPRASLCAPDAARAAARAVREIVLTEAAAEPPIPVYDTTGPYTDPDVTIDVEQGSRARASHGVRERGGVEELRGRPTQPVDNGNVSGKHLARNFPTAHRPLRAANGKPLRNWNGRVPASSPRRWSTSPSARNLGRQAATRARRSRARDGESFGAAVPAFVTPEFVRSEVARGAPSFPPTSTTPSSKR